MTFRDLASGTPFVAPNGLRDKAGRAPLLLKLSPLYEPQSPSHDENAIVIGNGTRLICRNDEEVIPIFLNFS